MNALRQLHRLPRLVGLQRADQMQVDTPIIRAQIRPAPCGLLHPVFPKYPMALIQNGANAILGLHLADSDQGDRAGGAIRLGFGFGDTGCDFGQ